MSGGQGRLKPSPGNALVSSGPSLLLTAFWSRNRVFLLPLHGGKFDRRGGGQGIAQDRNRKPVLGAIRGQFADQDAFEG